jgi:hypothetical protein
VVLLEADAPLLGYDHEDHRESSDKQGLALGITVEF